MNRLTTLLTLAFLLLCVPMAQAQTTITTTTLTNAMLDPSTGSKTIVVGSATGIAVNGILYIDGSVYRVTAVSGTTITVNNTYQPATHNASVTVYVVPVAAQIGLNPVGSCIRGTAGRVPQYSPYTLMFNLTSGDVARCMLTTPPSTYNWRITNPFSVGAPSNAPPQTQ